MNNCENIFVTGADGMLGSSICRELIRQGYSIKDMILPERNLNVLSNLNIEFFEVKILDKDLLQKEFNLPQTPIEKGIELCIDWFELNGYLK